MLESPIGLCAFHIPLPSIAIRQIQFLQNRAPLHERHHFFARTGPLNAIDEIGIVEAASHAVRNMQVLQTIAIQVLEARRPGPIRTAHAQQA